MFCKSLQKTLWLANSKSVFKKNFTIILMFQSHPISLLKTCDERGPVKFYKQGKSCSGASQQHKEHMKITPPEKQKKIWELLREAAAANMRLIKAIGPAVSRHIHIAGKVLILLIVRHHDELIKIVLLLIVMYLEIHLGITVYGSRLDLSHPRTH